MSRMYTVKDIAAGYFANPVTFRSRGEAVRTFLDSCQPDSGTVHAKHAQDFSLYEIAEFDELTGCIHTHLEPVFVCSGDHEKPNQEVA